MFYTITRTGNNIILYSSNKHIQLLQSDRSRTLAPCWRTRHGRPLVLRGKRGVCNVTSPKRVQQTGFKELNNAAAGETGGQCLDSQQARSSQTPPPPPPKSHCETAVLLDERTCPCHCIKKSKPILGLTSHYSSY